MLLEFQNRLNCLDFMKIDLKKIKSLYLKKDRTHNYNHILRLKRNVNVLKKQYKKLDEDLLNFLVNFHGLGDYIKGNKDKFPKNYIESFLRHNKKPKLIEEKLVFDANMLDNVGKQGIKKSLEYGKQINRTKEDTLNYLRANINQVKFYTKIGKQLGDKQIKIMKEIIK